jgi:hypothetical protein
MFETKREEKRKLGQLTNLMREGQLTNLIVKLNFQLLGLFNSIHVSQMS